MNSRVMSEDERIRDNLLDILFGSEATFLLFDPFKFISLQESTGRSKAYRGEHLSVDFIRVYKCQKIDIPM
jgi:hypothetical protein